MFFLLLLMLLLMLMLLLLLLSSLTGNDKIHTLTQKNQKLNILLTDVNGTTSNGFWTQFLVAKESNNYMLTVSV